MCPTLNASSATTTAEGNVDGVVSGWMKLSKEKPEDDVDDDAGGAKARGAERKKSGRA
jgi:hypothetical protein